MSKKIILTIFLSLLIIHSVFSQNSDEIQINKFIAKQANKYSAEESVKGRKIVYGNLNEGKSKEMVVLYTLEGFGENNNYLQYLAIFEKTKSGKLKFINQKIIGGKNERAVELISIKNRKIDLDVLNYLPADASCCPSKKGRIQITLKKNKLAETKAAK